MLQQLEQNGVYVKPAFLPQEDDNKLRHIIYVDDAGQEHEIVAVHEIGLPGRYNVENALAAVAISIAVGVNPASLREPLMSFRGVEHRLEYVETKQGVVFYNNSKATNSKATIMALGALKEPIILIAGGLDRGSDYLELLPYLQSKVKAVVALGQTKEKIAAVASKAGLTEIHLVDTESSAAETLQNATRQAAKLAGTGDVVLLSPACASWDMFKSYEERGRIFKEAVHTL
jgi:UDP-N-acetylmuramoylalanine--D-glutamate ligase